MQNKWLSISGLAGSGKDTLGNFFLPQGYTKINFGDNLKRMCAFAFNLEINLFYDVDLKEKLLDVPIILNGQNLGKLDEWITKTHSFHADMPYYYERILKSPREIMQFVGTDVIRTEYPNYHVETTIPAMKDIGKVICCDVRFPNELEAMRVGAEEIGADFKSLYVLRKDYVNTDTHASEVSITSDMCNVIIHNDRDIDNLKHLARLFY